jgi:RNA polymerase sigma-70 factor (ECF subfamily)
MNAARQERRSAVWLDRGTVSSLGLTIEDVYLALGPPLLAYARSLVTDAAAAEDAVHQVFLKMIASHAALPREPRPYLFRAVRNTCLNRRRAARREQAQPAAAVFVAEDGLAALVPDIERALADLPDDQREIVILRVWGEMTLQAAADVVGIPLNTAASRYRYALDKLRQRFGVQLRS